MIFYILHLPGIEEERFKLLKTACSKLKIPFKALDPFSFDFSKPSPLKQGDLLYRVGRGKLLRSFEDFLVQKDTITFYQDPLFHPGDPFILEKNGIKTPLTVLCVSNKRSLLTTYVKKLGGFPIVIKALGGTRGLGVMKVDSFSTLFGIIDYFLAQGKLLILREFIPVTISARLIVLGKKIIGSMAYKVKGNDFRTNASSTPIVLGAGYPQAIQELAIKATEAMGFEFAGVDILIYKSRAYVIEVNFPCNFVRAHKVLKKDIALEMVKYLKAKSLNLYKISRNTIQN